MRSTDRTGALAAIVALIAGAGCARRPSCRESLLPVVEFARQHDGEAFVSCGDEVVYFSSDAGNRTVTRNEALAGCDARGCRWWEYAGGRAGDEVCVNLRAPVGQFRLGFQRCWHLVWKRAGGKWVIESARVTSTT